MKKQKNTILFFLGIFVLFGCSFYMNYRKECKDNILFNENITDGAVHEEATLFNTWEIEIEPRMLFNLENIDYDNCTYELEYDENIVNEIQKMLVKVEYKGVSNEKEFELFLSDYQKPVIEYNGNTEYEHGEGFDVEENLNVYDEIAMKYDDYAAVQKENEKRAIIREDSDQFTEDSVHLKAGYIYYLGDDMYADNEFKMGLNIMTVFAWDGHGNQTEATFEITLTE